MVNFNSFFSLLKKNNINVPISLHVEYDLGGAEHGKIPTMDYEEIFKKIKKDVTFIRQTWDAIE
jgi:sugar phosphate isomerase/epimerase